MAQQALLITKLSENAIIQKNCSAAAARYDLCSAADAVMPAQDKYVVPMDLAVAAPMAALHAEVDWQRKTIWQW